jgi:hypothetical protein
MQECAQELARCLADGGDKKGTQAYLRIHEIISARVRACATSFAACVGVFVIKRFSCQ